MLPTVRGVPWWGAVLVAIVFAGVGAMLDDTPNGDLGSTYKFFLFVGCVAAALAVRRRALFTAAVQPPLIGLGISLATLYQIHHDQADNLKGLLVTVIPKLAATFPAMATTFVVTLLIVVGRWYITRSAGNGGKKSDAKDAAPRTSAAKATAAKTTTAKTTTAKTTATRSRTAPKSTGDTTATGTPAGATKAPGERGASAATRQRAPRPREAGTARTTAAPETPRKRATAGQVLRKDGGPQLGDDPQAAAGPVSRDSR